MFSIVKSFKIWYYIIYNHALFSCFYIFDLLKIMTDIVNRYTVVYGYLNI